MTEQSDFSDPPNDPRAQNLVRVVERFVDTLHERAGKQHLTRVTNQNRKLDGRVIDQAPERFIEDELIAPVAKVLGYDIRFRPKGFDGLEGRIPDFTLLNLGVENLGEVKTPGSISEARSQSVEYLDLATDRPLVGFATDGLTWILYTASGADERATYRNHERLNSVISRVRKEQVHESAGRRNRRNLRREAYSFVQELQRDSVRAKVDG